MAEVKAKEAGASSAQVSKAKQKAKEQLPSVDVEARFVELELELSKVRSQLADQKQAQVESTSLLTEIYGKIDYEGIPLPPEVMEMFVDKESWVWMIAFHAMLTSLFTNPAVIAKEGQVRAAVNMAFRGAGYFVEELHKKCDTSDDDD